MTTNTPMVVWKASKHPEICKAFMKTLYDEDTYVEFLHATPVGMLPAIKGIADTDAYKDDDTIRQFTHAEEVQPISVLHLVMSTVLMSRPVLCRTTM